jgi:hypothetical protein
MGLWLKSFVRSRRQGLGCWPSWWSRREKMRKQEWKRDEKRRRLGWMMRVERVGDMGRWAHALLRLAHGWLDRGWMDWVYGWKDVVFHSPWKKEGVDGPLMVFATTPCGRVFSDRPSATTPLGNPPLTASLDEPEAEFYSHSLLNLSAHSALLPTAPAPLTQS